VFRFGLVTSFHVFSHWVVMLGRDDSEADNDCYSITMRRIGLFLSLVWLTTFTGFLVAGVYFGLDILSENYDGSPDKAVMNRQAVSETTQPPTEPVYQEYDPKDEQEIPEEKQDWLRKENIRLQGRECPICLSEIFPAKKSDENPKPKPYVVCDSCSNPIHKDCFEGFPTAEPGCPLCRKRFNPIDVFAEPVYRFENQVAT
jgi:hypothetical protein